MTQTANPTTKRWSIVNASLLDLRELRNMEQVCFPQDAWPLLDLIGVLSMPGVVRLKAVSEAGGFIGFVAGDMRRWENVAWIATIAVLPEYRGQGIGAALLEACEAQITIPVLRLCVRTDNLGAIRLYERFGYHRKGEWKDYYQDGAPALVMEKVRGER